MKKKDNNNKIKYPKKGNKITINKYRRKRNYNTLMQETKNFTEKEENPIFSKRHPI